MTPTFCLFVFCSHDIPILYQGSTILQHHIGLQLVASNSVMSLQQPPMVLTSVNLLLSDFLGCPTCSCLLDETSGCNNLVAGKSQ